MTNDERKLVEMAVTLLVANLRSINPRLTPGEIYDALAQELERRCDRIIRGESFTGEA